MKKLLLSAFIVGTFLTSCKTEETSVKKTVFKGQVENFQHGKAWSWVEVDNDDKPMRLGIAINDSAMNIRRKILSTSNLRLFTQPQIPRFYFVRKTDSKIVEMLRYFGQIWANIYLSRNSNKLNTEFHKLIPFT